MIKKRKKFGQTDVGRILKGVASIAVPGVVKALEGANSVGDAIQRINESTDLSQEEKNAAQELLTRRLESDNASGQWLPSNIRPLTLCVLVIAYIVGFFLEYDVEVFHSPLMTVFMFYFGGRTWEKLKDKH